MLVADFSWASYQQRFISTNYRSGSDLSPSMRRTFQKISKRYPWLLSVQQPTAEFDFSRRWDGFGLHEQIHGLPNIFLSQRRTIWHYADGSESMHIYVDDNSPEFHDFLARTRKQLPIVVVTRNTEQEVTGRYLYTERSFLYIYNRLKTAGFSIHRFLDEIEPPLANMAAGGVRLSRELSLNAKQPLDVFSVDVSGSHRTYQSNPHYLFANIEKTGIPDNSLGAILSLGGPLAIRSLDVYQAKIILRELVRITKPGGRLLIEYTTPRHVFLQALQAIKSDIADSSVYALVSSSNLPIAELIDITVDNCSSNSLRVISC